jgi:type VI secretion system protein ImpL
MAVKLFLRILLITFVWSLIAGTLAAITFFWQQDVMLGLYIAAGLFMAWVVWRIVRAVLIRFRARARVAQLANVEEAPVDQNNWMHSLVNFYNKPPLHKRINAVLSFLKNSELSNNQDHRYALPWFISLTSKQCDSNALMQHANVVKPTHSQEGFNSDDLNTRWWLYNQGVVITTGNDLCSKNAKTGQWQQLLHLLSKHRSANPINGVLLSLNVNELLNNSTDQLHAQGQEFRARIDEAMSRLGIEVPVYLLFTGLEELAGFNELIDDLEDEQLNQFFGKLNRNKDIALEFCQEFILEAAETVQQQLLTVLLNSESPSGEMIQLPSKFRSLNEKISAFSDSCFQHSAFQSNPEFRGIAFTAHRYSEDRQTVKSLFTKTLFNDILIQENRVAGNLPEAEQRSKKVRSAIFISYITVMCIVGAGFIFSYINQNEFITGQQTEFAGTMVERQEISKNIDVFTRMNQLITNVDQHPWMPWLGSEPRFVLELQESFVTRANKSLFDPLHSDLAWKAEQELFTSGDPELMAQYVSALIDQTSWLEGYISGLNDEDLATLTPPFSLDYPSLSSDTTEQQVENLNQLFLNSLRWNNSKEKATRLLDNQQALLAQILAKYPDLSWVEDWANKLYKSDRVKLKTFWKGGASFTADSVKKHEIPGAYTLAGKTAIDSLLDTIRRSQSENEALIGNMDEFYLSYQNNYLNQWESFLINFKDGAQVLGNRSDWLTLVDNLPTDKNPFNLVMTQAHNELESFIGGDLEPDWLYLIDYYQQVLELLGQSPAGAKSSNAGLAKVGLKVLGKAGKVGKLAAGVGKKALKTKKKMDKGKGGGPGPSERELAMETVSEHVLSLQEGINNIVFNAEKRLVSLTAIKDHFNQPDNPGAGTTAYSQVWSALGRIEMLLGRENRGNKAFWQNLRGSAIVSQRYLTQEATCGLQDLWQEQYITQLDGVPQNKVTPLAFSVEGLAWTFADETLKPFVKKKFGAGFVASKLDGQALSIKDNLFGYLNQGLEFKLLNQPYYDVLVQSKPISVNEGAKKLPHQSVVSMNCPEQEYELINRNFPASQMMQWSTACSGLNIEIYVGRYVIKRKYPGELGFARFLKEFNEGQVRLPIDQFPEYEDRLDQMGIEYFDLGFRFKQQIPVIKQLTLNNLRIPANIATCWDTTAIAMEL